MLTFCQGVENFRITEEISGNMVTYTVCGLGFEFEDDGIVVGTDMEDTILYRLTFFSCFNLNQIVYITRYRDNHRLACCYELRLKTGQITVEIL